jgi:crotonobetainyl-CoA:carnitine CoA-transferase CaiB-like acyl-CoA transferase
MNWRLCALPALSRSDEMLPLEGLRVADLTIYWAGPFATKFLADYGADVIKVESPIRPDIVRIAVTSAATDGPDFFNKSAYFNNYSRNKRSIGLDISRPEGAEILRDLIRQSDILVENFRADVIIKMGLAYEEVRKINPGIIMLSLGGFGKSGPDMTMPGIGITMEQMSGLASLNTYGDGVPFNTGVAYGDPNAGIMGFAAILMALMRREETGEGCWIDLSQQENLICMFGEQFLEYSWNGREPRSYGNGSPYMSPHGCFPSAGDNRWVALSVEDDEQWRALCALAGTPALAGRYPGLLERLESADEIYAEIAAWTAGLGDMEAAQLLQESGIPASPVEDILDILEDPHMQARGFFVPVEDQALGVWPHDGFAWRFSSIPGEIRQPAPLFGQHTEEVLTGLLGRSEAEVRRLSEERVTSHTLFSV